MAQAGDKLTDSIAIADWTETKLDRVSVDVSGWLILFRHRETGQYWRLSYPQGEMHGGGPPLLTCLGDTDVNWLEKH